jgi:hypothetical protein
MPTEETYKDLMRKRSAVELLEIVRADLHDAINGAEESRGQDQWLSDLILRLDVALEKMREER